MNDEARGATLVTFDEYYGPWFKCPHCGYEGLTEGSLYCNRCGGEVITDSNIKDE